MGRIGILILIVLFSGSAYSKEEPQAPRADTKAQTKGPSPANENFNSYPKPTASMPSIPLQSIPPNASSKPAESAKDESENASEYWTIAGHSLKITDSLLVIFTAFLFMATLFLYRATRNLVRGAEDTARRQLRAYVSIDLAGIRDLSAGLTPIANLRVKNFGKTPAYDLAAIGGIAIGKSFGQLPAPTGPTGISRSTLSIGAVSDQFHRAPRPLSPEEIAALAAGTLTLWVYGELQYRDTFNIQHITKYRFQTGGTAGVCGDNLAVCQEGNEET